MTLTVHGTKVINSNKLVPNLFMVEIRAVGFDPINGETGVFIKIPVEVQNPCTDGGLTSIITPTSPLTT